jgi:hypothetical protein
VDGNFFGHSPFDVAPLQREHNFAVPRQTDLRRRRRIPCETASRLGGRLSVEVCPMPTPGRGFRKDFIYFDSDI